MRGALELLGRALAEPPFDHVHPRGAGRREVHVKAGTRGQPPTDRRGLVGAIVIEDQVDIDIDWHAAVDLIRALAKRLRPITRFTASDDLAGLGIQGREVGHRAMPYIGVRAPLDLARLHREQRLRPFEGVNLRLLINAPYQRAVERGQIPPTISRTFSMHCGSVDRLNVSTRGGCGPKARHMRLTVLWLSPVFCARAYLDLTRFRGFPTRPSTGAEVAHGIAQEGGPA